MSLTVLDSARFSDVHESQATQRQTRVALLTNFIPPYQLAVLTEFSSMVAELRVFLSTEMEGDRNWETQWGGLNVKVQKTLTFARHRRHKLGFSSRYYFHIPYDTLANLIRYRPDVVISGQLGFRTMQSSLFKALYPATGLVSWADLSEHTERGVGWGRRKVRRILLRSSDVVLVNGRSGEEYVSQFGVPPECIVHMPFVRDMGDLLQIPVSRTKVEGKRLLYVGSLVEGKGLHLLFDALGRWRRANPNELCSLSIAGDGPMRGDLEQRSAHEALRVRFLGYVPFEQISRIYAQADLFVFPTLADTWGLVVNEALAAGVPVLGSQYSQAVTELLVDGHNGWTFHPDQSHEFDTQLARALSTPANVLHEMALFARSTVEQLTPTYAAKRMALAAQLARNAAHRRVASGSIESRGPY